MFLRWKANNQQEGIEFIPLSSCDGIRRPKALDLSQSNVSEDLICFKCHEILHDPVCANPCGDPFCRKCLEQILSEETPTCPICEDLLENSTLVRSRPTERKLKNLKFWCENGVFFDAEKAKFFPLEGMDDSCPEVLSLSNLEDHLKSCQFSLCACPNEGNGCPLIFTKMSLKIHVEICTFSPKTSSGEKIPSSQFPEVTSSFQAEEVECPHARVGCKTKVQRIDLKSHLESCPYEAVKLDIYKHIAEKAFEEAYNEAVEKLATLQVEPSDFNPKWEEMRAQAEREATEKFREISTSENVPLELSETLQIKLAEKLQGNEFSESCEKAISSRQSSSSSQSSSLDQATFTFAQMKEATENFSAKNLLGKGGFGSVYRGNLYGTPVAVKKLHDGGNPREFELEVNVLKKIRHPHIVLLMGCCPEAGCIVSEFLPGGSLHDRLALQGTPGNLPPLPWKDRLRIFQEVSSAILFLHKSNILHRDLKPANILLSDHNSSKLADMGLAKLFEGTIPEGPASGVKGTVGYLDPHQLTTGELSKASDIYAFGLIILQVLTGQKRVQAVHNILQRSGPSQYRRDLDRACRIFMAELDPRAGQWGEEFAAAAIKVAVRCVERLPENRPDLEEEIQPELYRIYRAAETGQWEPRKPPMKRSISEATGLEGNPSGNLDGQRSLPANLGSPGGDSMSASDSFVNMLFPGKGGNGAPNVGPPLHPKADEKEALRLKEMGQQEVREGQFLQAFTHFGEALQKLPEDHSIRGTLHSLRASTLLEIRPLNSAQVVTEASLALALNPNDITARISRSKGSEAQGDHESAIADLERIILVNPHHQEAQTSLSRLRTSFSRGTISPTSSENLPPVSQIYQPNQALNRPSEVRREQSMFLSYSSLLPPPAPSHYPPQYYSQQNSNVNSGRPQWQSSATSYNATNLEGGVERAVELARDKRDYGNRQYKCKQYEDALNSYNEGLQMLPQNHEDRATLYGNRAACYLEFDPPQFEQALRECDLALAINPNFVKGLVRRAKACKGLGRLEEAQADVQRALQADPHSKDAISLQQSLLDSQNPLSPSNSSNGSIDNSGFVPPAIQLGGVHFGHYCDECGSKPICGIRYVSRRRRDYDLCTKCMSKRSQLLSKFESVLPPGESNAEFMMSLGYPNGICHIQTEQQYVYLLHVAARKGNAAALCDLGIAYQTGRGVALNQAEAVRLFNLSTAQGHPSGQFLLGKCFATGRGLQMDFEKAASLFEMAANQDHLSAQFELGNCYLLGKGKTKNEVEGVKWIRKAASQGHKEAERTMGRCYSEGIGVTRSYNESQKWFQASSSD